MPQSTPSPPPPPTPAATLRNLRQRLPAGYATVLGRWFGGAELSVGEWQRVALARAFLRDAPLIKLNKMHDIVIGLFINRYEFGILV